MKRIYHMCVAVAVLCAICIIGPLVLAVGVALTFLLDLIDKRKQ
jgi:hypothetical protein